MSTVFCTIFFYSYTPLEGKKKIILWALQRKDDKTGRNCVWVCIMKSCSETVHQNNCFNKRAGKHIDK